MASHVIQLSDDLLLTEYVALDDFKGVLEQRLGIGPDLLALLIRDGEVVQATHGAHIAIGGMWQSVKDAVIGSHTLRLLIADLKPFQQTAGFSAISRDKVPVAGELILELQVNPE